MTLAAAFLVVLASVIHATWNLLAKRAAAVGASFVFAYNLVSVVAYAPWAIWQIANGGVVWSWPVAAALLASGVIHLGYSLCLQRGYQVADLSVVYPVARGTGPLLSTLGAILILGEAPTALSILGLLLVVGGIFLIATQGRLAAFAQPGGQAGLRWGTATGGLIAGYTVVDAWAVKGLGVAPVLVDWFVGVFRFVFLLPMVLADPARAWTAMRGHWGLAIGVGLLSPLSYILVLWAMSMGAPLSTVAPMREMSMMVGALFGLVFLGERVGPWRLAGCGVLILGVIALASPG